MLDLIELKEVICDSRAKDGTWCKMPYPEHPNGCPNFPDCPSPRLSFTAINRPQKSADGKSLITYQWYAVIEEFDLKKHAEKMKSLHPKWTEKQCRCVLYWQGTVRKNLRLKAIKYKRQVSTEPDGFCYEWACHLLDIPEAHGVNLFGTMAKAGIILYKNPDMVRKIMLIGKPVTSPVVEEVANEGERKQ